MVKETQNLGSEYFLDDHNSETYKQFLEFLKIKKLMDDLKKDQAKKQKIIQPKSTDILIPLSIFTKDLGALECICKFLKENSNLKNKEISKLTNRNSKSVWQAISLAKKKHEKQFLDINFQYSFPVSILKNESLSILENIVYYLVNSRLTLHKIAILLKRDDRTIWTVYNRARNKK